MKKMTTVLAAAALAAGVEATEFMIECENFPQAPGFKVEYMGISSKGKYLRMNKKGATVSAKTAVPETGDYYVWVRDYSMCGNSRKGTVYLNGKKVGTFGDRKTADGKPAWNWVCSIAPTHLEANETLEIKLVAQNDYTRFDLILFTTDKDYKPEGNADDVAELELVD